MFKFIEYRHFEVFDHFLNNTIEVPYQPRIKYTLQPFLEMEVNINPIIIAKSETLPYNDPITSITIANELIYLTTQNNIQIYDISAETKLITLINHINPLSLLPLKQCLIVGSPNLLTLYDITKDFNIMATLKLDINVDYILYLDHQDMDYYDLVLLNTHADAIKVYCNVYKLFSKKTITFTTKLLLAGGYQNKPWWAVKGPPIVFNALPLRNRRFVIQLQNGLDIFLLKKDSIHHLQRVNNDTIEPGALALNGNQLLCAYGKYLHVFNDNNEILQESFQCSKKLEFPILGLYPINDHIILIDFEINMGIYHLQTEQFQILELKYSHFASLIGITGDTLEFLQFLNVEEYISQLSQKLQFKEAMQVALKVINGEISLLGITDITQMNTIFQKLAFTEAIFQLKNDTQDSTDSIIEIIKFLIKTKNIEYLFTVIKDVLAERFDQIIHTLIQKHQIPYIPDEYLYTLCQTKDVEFIEQLINSLDMRQVQSNILIKVCESLNLYDDIIYICQEKNDFVTPIAKLMGGDPLPRKCLNYVVSVLEGKFITGGEMDDQQYQEALRNLVQFLFVRENLIRFLQFKESLDVIFHFFQPKAMKAIQAQKINIQIKISTLEGQLQCFDDLDIATSIHRRMFQMLHSILEDIQFAYFGAKLMIIHFPLNQEMGYQILKKLMQNYERLDLGEYQYLENQFLMKTLVARTLSQSQYCALLDCVSMSLRQNTLVAVFIHSQLQEFRKAFDCFMEIKDENNRNLVFYWLQNLLQIRPMILNSQNDSFLIETMKNLIEIDEDKAHQFIDKHLHSKHYVILNTLPPHRFASYMEFLFSNQSKLYLINDQTKILYLKHMCKEQPKQVLAILKNVLFPIDEALKLTLEYNILLGAAYLYTVTGAISSALDIYIKIYLKKLKKYLAILMKQQILKQQQMEKLQIRLDNVTSLIVQEDSFDLSYWFQFLDQFFKENKLRTFSMKIPQALKDLLAHQLSEIFCCMSKYVDVTELFEQLNLKYGELPIHVFRDTIFTIRQRFLNDHETLVQVQEIYNREKRNSISEQLTLTVINHKIQASAWIANNECNRCQMPLSDSVNAFIFSCRHAYHDYCVLKGYAKIPFCDICNEEIPYKVIVEKCLKFSQITQQQSEIKLLSEMSVNYFATNLKQQVQVENIEVNKLDLLRNYDSNKKCSSWL